jgi:hypothetical protein
MVLSGAQPSRLPRGKRKRGWPSTRKLLRQIGHFKSVDGLFPSLLAPLPRACRTPRGLKSKAVYDRQFIARFLPPEPIELSG